MGFFENLEDDFVGFRLGKRSEFGDKRKEKGERNKNLCVHEGFFQVSENFEQKVLKFGDVESLSLIMLKNKQERVSFLGINKKGKKN